MTLETMRSCRYCGCTEEESCTLANGDTCGWFNRDCSVCTSPACIRKETARLRSEAESAKPQKRTPAQIHALIRGRKRSGLARRIRRRA